jgi:hypothetical protein
MTDAPRGEVLPWLTGRFTDYLGAGSDSRGRHRHPGRK